MFEVILYFPDEVNLKAFMLIEDISWLTINGSLIEAILDLNQVERACNRFGAEVRRISRP